jgi:hypothetical protein
MFQGSNNVDIVPLGEEPGEEYGHDDQEDQYGAGRKACPGCNTVDRLPWSHQPIVSGIGVRQGFPRGVGHSIWRGTLPTGWRSGPGSGSTASAA